MPDNVEEYILCGINNYHLSENQIVDNLQSFGMSKTDAEKILTDTLKKYGIYKRKHLFDGENDIHSWLIILFYGIFIIMNIWSFVQIIRDNDMYGYGGNEELAHADAVLAGSMIALSIFTAIRVFLCKKDGAFLSYACFVISFASTLLCAIFSIGETDRVLTMVACSIGFGLFLVLSDTLKKHFVKTTKHFYWYDIVIVALAVLICGVVYFIDRSKHTSTYTDTIYDYQEDLNEYVKRMKEKCPMIDSTKGECIDSLQYSSYDNELTLSISTIARNTNESFNNIVGKMSEYFSEPSLLILLYGSLPDSLTYYMYGTGAILNIEYLQSNGNLIVHKQYSYEELMDTLTPDQWTQYFKEMNRYQIDLSNTLCPQVIDDVTTLVGCAYQEKTNLNVYTIKLGISINDISANTIEKQLYQSCKSIILLNKEIWMSTGVGVRYKYYDKNNTFVTTIEFTPEQISSLK